ncbi:MAG: IS4 family transposase [Proteobacteria bacterium]|nr:IS4 family transposase [Pseudomonadota bacterium]
MYSGRLVFSQLIDFLPMHRFRQCVNRYDGNRHMKSFSCFDQFLCMAFAQLSYRESLRDIESCLRAMQNKLYHLGIRSHVSRSTLADANEKRDWRIFADFAQVLIGIARELYSNDEFGVELDETVYALDSSTIDLCLSVFPWAKFRKTKAAIKMHTLLDLRGSIPSFVSITHGKVHDVKVLDRLIPEPGAIYVMDRAYLDFERLYLLNQCMAFFVIRSKKNTLMRRLYSREIDKTTGLRCDQTIVLTGIKTRKQYPDRLRRVKYFDEEKARSFSFISNNFIVPALVIAELYRCRWQVELFFKWIKQNLRIKAFYGTSENAVKTQIWIAVSVYVLVAIVKKQMRLHDLSLYTILQILSVTLFEKEPLFQVLESARYTNMARPRSTQLELFDY